LRFARPQGHSGHAHLKFLRTRKKEKLGLENIFRTRNNITDEEPNNRNPTRKKPK